MCQKSFETTGQRKMTTFCDHIKHQIAAGTLVFEQPLQYIPVLELCESVKGGFQGFLTFKNKTVNEGNQSTVMKSFGAFVLLLSVCSNSDLISGTKHQNISSSDHHNDGRNNNDDSSFDSANNNWGVVYVIFIAYFFGWFILCKALDYSQIGHSMVNKIGKSATVAYESFSIAEKMESSKGKPKTGANTTPTVLETFDDIAESEIPVNIPVGQFTYASPFLKRLLNNRTYFGSDGVLFPNGLVAAIVFTYHLDVR